MELTIEERNMLAGEQGQATRKAMEILVALGKIYGAERMVPVASVQIAGVSYDNLGEAGLQFLEEMAAGGESRRSRGESRRSRGESRRSRDGRVRVLTTLNPAGMDVENWESLGISPDFAANQRRVLEAFARMGVVTTCTCTPYLAGNLPGFGEHLAWAESSAVCYANSVIGARTNREGGPSALAAALTGRTPAYGFHLDSQRLPSLAIDVTADLEATGQWGATLAFGALGWAIGKHLEAAGKRRVVYIRGVRHASLEALKAFCASLATYGGAALFHMEGITPESGSWPIPPESLPVRDADLEEALAALSDASAAEVDFVSLGCPHLTLREIARIAELLAGQRVKKEFWITTSRPVKGIADQMGYTRIIEASGAKFATDTCCVVAPIQGRFKALATDSAKACYYAYAKNGFKTRFLPFDQVVSEAVK